MTRTMKDAEETNNRSEYCTWARFPHHHGARYSIPLEQAQQTTNERRAYRGRHHRASQSTLEHILLMETKVLIEAKPTQRCLGS